MHTRAGFCVFSDLSQSGTLLQASGMCYTYDISKAKGSRVVKAVRQAADGSCSGAEVSLSGSTPDYTITLTDFLATSVNLNKQGVAYRTLDTMQDVIAGYIALPGFKPAPIQGRIVCIGGSKCPQLVAA